MKAKPVLKWAGGKAASISQLFAVFPDQIKRRYIEPFVGGGAMFFALEHEKGNLLNDINTEVINLYEVIRDEPVLLMQTLDQMASCYSEKSYYHFRDDMVTASDNKIAAAARTLFLNKTGFNGLYRQNKSGVFNVPFGKRVKCPALYDRENILRAALLFTRATLSSDDFEIVLDKAGKGDLVYCDPPYEPLTVSSNFTAYQKGGFSQQDQIRLKEACIRANKRGAYVVLSNSSADFIKQLYADFETRTVEARRAINSKGDKRGFVEEILVIWGA